MKRLLLLVGLVTFLNVNAQISGNQSYEKSYDYDRNPVQNVSILSTDSTLIVKSKVLLNKLAKNYTITVSVNSFAKTVIEANKKTNKKIENVTKKIKNIGVKERDIYVDFVSETKMYDHSLDENEIKEFFDGFSIRKNMMIKTSDLNNIDRIIDICSEEEIYDIVKVDYVSEDIEKINDILFNEALKIAKAKTKRFQKNSSIQLSNKYRIVSENLNTYYPKNLYKEYKEAFETSLVKNYYNSSYIKKETRKERTFYYDGVETELGIDKFIDEISPVVGIQYVLSLSIQYDLKK